MRTIGFIVILLTLVICYMLATKQMESNKKAIKQAQTHINKINDSTTNLQNQLEKNMADYEKKVKKATDNLLDE